MSTNPQARAYYQLDHEPQGKRALAYVTDHYLCEINEIAKGINIPPGRVSARLNPYLKSGQIGEYEPPEGNTQYFATQTPEEAQREAAKWGRRNHPITKVWLRLKKEGKGTPEVYAHLMRAYNAMEGTNHLTEMTD